MTMVRRLHATIMNWMASREVDIGEAAELRDSGFDFEVRPVSNVGQMSFIDLGGNPVYYLMCSVFVPKHCPMIASPLFYTDKLQMIATIEIANNCAMQLK
jgi:hypothetical protein